MKFSYILLLLCCLCLVSSPSWAQRKKKKQVSVAADTTVKVALPAPRPDKPILKFETDAYDFDKAKQGDQVKHSFRFTNAGGKDLILTSVNPSCGCTVVGFPHDPIKPGGEGVIDITFNTSGKMGPQQKTITVLANTDPAVQLLHLTGQVISPTIPIPQTEEATPDSTVH